MENVFFQAFDTSNSFCSKPNIQSKGYKDCMKNNRCIQSVGGYAMAIAQYIDKKWRFIYG